MEEKQDPSPCPGAPQRAPWTGLTVVVAIAALFITLYPSLRMPQLPQFLRPNPATASPLPADLPDFSAIPVVSEKKRAFFTFMKPLVESENKAILATRNRLIELHAEEGYSPKERSWLMTLAANYRVEPFSPDSPEDREALLTRVDLIPLSLALAQAANESAWGTSRFASEGNNIFGQWVFGKGKGIVPKDRDEGATHEVARFETVSDSIRSYLHNLNTLWAYQPLRDLRREQRARGEVLDGETLALGIGSYSSRGDAYIKEIQRLIRINTPLISKKEAQQPSP